MSPQQIINNVRKQLMQQNAANDKSRLQAHKAELRSKASNILKKRDFINQFTNH